MPSGRILKTLTVSGAATPELDILVHRADRVAFRRLAVAHGFAEYRHHVDVYGGELAHFIHFADGVHHHLHVHYALLTGDHLMKEYRLDELFVEDLLFKGPPRQGIRTVEEVAELAIGVVRLALRAGSLSGVKVSELARLRSIYSADLFAGAIEVIERRIALPCAAVERFRAILAGDGRPPRRTRRACGLFSPLRRLSPFRARVSGARLRIVDGVARRMGLSNKVLLTPAPTIAIIGVDGSGKSTVATALQRTLARKVSVRCLYLGGNTRSYTLLTRVAYDVHRASLLASRLVPRSAFTLDLSSILSAHLEYRKCRDRVRRIRSGQRAARRAWSSSSSAIRSNTCSTILDWFTSWNRARSRSAHLQSGSSAHG